MEIVGQLTGGVVHDFNNILTVISGTIDILAEAVADRPDLAAITGLITEAAARGAHLTSHLLAFAHGQPSQPRDVDVNALLVDAARLLRPTLGEQIEIDTMPAAGPSLVRVDPSQLMTAILNLAIMARDAMPEGGKLVFVTNSPATQQDCDDASSEANAARTVAVTVKASRHGGAAGYPIFNHLTTIEHFVAQSGGHIDAHREAGGASIEVHLPRATVLAEPPAEVSGPGGDEAILIVEDDVLVRRYVVAQVQSLGYRTFAANDAGEALAIIDGAEKIDLLFTDVVMSGLLNGWQLAIAALNRRPLLKVLYTSGYARNAIVHDGCLDAGVLLLAKPYRKVDLAKAIRAALNT
jgi:CheY-like chemotaxis protein